MPHALPVPPSGFQALILCGPGVSLNTFTAHPEDYPKALIPIANRPMVWYPLDWCYRMGITKIHLITPHVSENALEAALSQNPHLTSLPLPRADIIAPKALTPTSGTAEILRLPEIRQIIEGDFMVIPCDLVCALAGENLLEAWMIEQAGLDGIGARPVDYAGLKPSLGGIKGGRRGGLGVWFQTKSDTSVKGEETDFVITAAQEPPAAPAPEGSLRKDVHKLLYYTTSDTLNDITEEKKSLPIRNGLIRKHGRVRLLNTYRDAHIYLFPFWALDMINHNEEMNTLSEDVVGAWAKATWQDGLGDKLGLRELLEGTAPEELELSLYDPNENELDIADLSTTRVTDTATNFSRTRNNAETSQAFSQSKSKQDDVKPQQKLRVPPMLAYIQPSDASSPLIRRVDTSALLLSISLILAKLDAIDDIGKPGSSPFAHQQKVAKQSDVAQRCTITRADCLVAENVTIEEKCVIKESVIGSRAVIKTGARLTRCIVMDGAVVEERCQLIGCILGFNSRIGKESQLKECEVQEGNAIPEETDSKGEKFMVFEGLDDEGDFGMDNDSDEAESKL